MSRTNYTFPRILPMSCSMGIHIPGGGGVQSLGPARIHILVRIQKEIWNLKNAIDIFAHPTRQRRIR